MAASPEITRKQALMSFNSTVALDAVQGLEKSRSDAFLTSLARRRQRLESERLRTVWDIKPIDFSVKIYQPHPSQRNSRESMVRDWGVVPTSLNELQSHSSRLIDPTVPQLQLPTLLKERKSDSRPKFETKHRPPSSQTSRVVFIREGKFKPERYFTDSVGVHRRDLFRKVIAF